MNASVAPLNEDAERAERIKRVKAKIAQLEKARAVTLDGTSKRHCANIRLIDAEVALINIEREGADNV